MFFIRINYRANQWRFKREIYEKLMLCRYKHGPTNDIVKIILSENTNCLQFKFRLSHLNCIIDLVEDQNCFRDHLKENSPTPSVEIAHIKMQVTEKNVYL